jgi:hypothetical protein
MSKYNVIVFRVSGQTAFQIEAASAGDAQEKALVLSEAAVFAEPTNRRVAVIHEDVIGAQLSALADREPAVAADFRIHIVPARAVGPDGRLKA